MKNICCITLLFSLVVLPVFARKITIRGTVTDDWGELIIGASIVIRGTVNGTITNFDGEYTLDVSVGDRVDYSFIGFNTHTEIIVADRTIYNVTLKEDNQLLSESIIISHGVASTPLSSNFIGVASVLSGSPYDQLNEETYTEFGENKFKSVKQEPVSTFSADVDKASYGNMRRFLEQGVFPPRDAIRTEELVNYFPYDYGQPTLEEPILIRTEMGICPWNQSNLLCRIGLKTRDIPTHLLPPSNFVFLIDVSGSMWGPTRLDLVKSSLSKLVDTLKPEDRISIVVYADQEGLVLPSTSGTKKNTIKEALKRLEAGGSTAGGNGIQLAYKVARENFMPEGNNRIILCTDGDFNVGISSPDKLKELVAEEKESGIFLTVLGYGMGNYRDDMLQTLAQAGNGNHAYIDTEKEAYRILVEEGAGTLYIVAKDVKLQVEFDPQQVDSYRLIGYETRLLDEEDFDDDGKDAGDMGSGHTVTAFYEIVPQAEAKRQMQNKSLHWLDVSMRYKHPLADTSELIQVPVNAKIGIKNSTDFNFAAAVVMFSQLIRDSEFKGDVSFQDVIRLASANTGTGKHTYRKEFIEQVKKAETIYKAGVRSGKPVPRGVIYIEEDDFDIFTDPGTGNEGVKDSYGNIIIPALYDQIDYMVNGVFRLEKDDKYGLYDVLTNSQTPLMYDDIEGLAQWRTAIFKVILENPKDNYDDRYGVIDRTGKLIIPVKYDDIDEQGNYLLVEKNDKYGLYSVEGKKMIPVKYDDIEDYGDYFTVEKNDKYGLYNQKGKRVRRARYEDEPERFASGLYLISHKDKQGIVNEKGKTIVPRRYEDIDDLTITGLLKVTKENGKEGLYNDKGKRLLRCVYDDIDVLEVETGVVTHQFLELEKNGKYGLASPDGRIIIPVKYDEVEIFDCYNPGDGGIDFVFRVEKNDKYGVYSSEGVLLVPVKYQEIENDMLDGVIIVHAGEETYYYHHTGEILLTAPNGGVAPTEEELI
ncbi:MAG: von Willebrand factor type A domain-containing protein [Tannerellaceae bacterium]|nr:von Willebrand factor type A domain-containing protein [Tannerellaceae bacterium]